MKRPTHRYRSNGHPVSHVVVKHSIDAVAIEAILIGAFYQDEVDPESLTTRSAVDKLLREQLAEYGEYAQIRGWDAGQEDRDAAAEVARRLLPDYYAHEDRQQ